LVEDNLVNQRVAQGILQKIGMKVVVANNGKEALKKLKQSSPKTFSAVLMDIEMPVLDGLQTTGLIRTQPSHFQHLPIIAMTAHAMSGDREKCSAVGMNAHIAKPINPTSVYKVLINQIQHGARH
jgi:CheY-like chemotaxis protein